MPVRYTPPTADQLLPVPGITLGTAAAKIKKWDREDVVLVVAERGAKAAGVFTQNRFRAAPVILCREHLAHQRATGGDFRALIVNAGNANAGTGPSGLKDAETTCAKAARLVGCSAQEVLPYSTGVIMEPLPVERVVAGIDLAYANARSDGWYSAARAIMTTDTVPKATSRHIEIDGARVTVTGIAKGAGMIHPNMATTLAFVVTDAAVSPSLLQRTLRDVTGRTFNAISVDGDTSTNDTLLILANGAAGAPQIAAQSKASRQFSAALEEVCGSLAQQIVADGEGAQRVIEIEVRGARTESAARRIAETIATSPLVKTAFAGADPNWGRIFAAAGRSGVKFDPALVEISMAGIKVLRKGQPLDFNERAASNKLLADRVPIVVDLHAGKARARYWTCDFTAEYVRINASYRT